MMDKRFYRQIHAVFRLSAVVYQIVLGSPKSTRCQNEHVLVAAVKTRITITA